MKALKLFILYMVIQNNRYYLRYNHTVSDQSHGVPDSARVFVLVSLLFLFLLINHRKRLRVAIVLVNLMDRGVEIADQIVTSKNSSH